ncbi:MAG: AAA family ATPase [Planctomycetes bacterium]|nr:AAA family ATPase [Planctomycetota bacterium]
MPPSIGEVGLTVPASYLAARLCVLPARAVDKRPDLAGWKTYQHRLPTAAEVSAWFSNPHDACCIICGAVSGNLEILDFDGAGALFDAWRLAVDEEAPGLSERLVIERTPSGGQHVIYRCVDPVSGNLKLASRREDTDGPAAVERFGKMLTPRRDRDGRWHVIQTLIETRGEGGLFLCAPSTGYGLVQGDLAQPPILTAEERDALLRCAWTLNEVAPEPADPQPGARGTVLRPGDDFNRRADLPALLQHHGWQLVRDGANQTWRRPGKTEGWSATLKDGVFYVFSSNAMPFESSRAYSPFAVLALLEHGGDFQATAAALRLQGFGAADVNPIDLSGLMPPPAGASLLFDLQSFADTPEREIDWLWPGVIPRGMVSLIGGKQGFGKSFLICDLAARISAGKPMPDGTQRPPSKVLLLAREDDASCVLLPRLRAAKADLSRVAWSVFSQVRTGTPLDLAAHVQLLADAVMMHAFDLIVVDTFAAFAPAGTDANDAQDVRCLLDALTRMARSTGAAVVVVAHLRKTGQGDGDPMDAIAGSAQMTAGVRVASMLDKGVRDGERWFRVVKSNLGRMDEHGWTWRFAWPDPFTEGASEMPHIEWATAGDEYAARSSDRQAEREDLDPAAVKAELREVLLSGPRTLASAAELAWARLQRAFPRLRKSEVEVAIQEIAREGALVDAWEGPRGAHLIGLPGTRTQAESPEDKAQRLADENPELSVRELRELAGCRKDTAMHALRLARSEPNEARS